MQENIKKGITTELQCLLSLTKLGYTVSVPYGNSARYDLIVDVNNKLYRIQCKTSRCRNEESFCFSCSNTQSNTKGIIHKEYTSEQIDYFMTIFEEQAYLIPVEECGKSERTLRIMPTKNNQKNGVLLAKDYLLKEKSFN